MRKAISYVRTLIVISYLQYINAFSISEVTSTIPDAVLYPFGFATAFRAGAAISVTNHPKVSPLDTKVGSKVLRLPSSGARLRLFYPTKDTSKSTAPYLTNGRQTSNAMAARVGFEQLGLSFLLAHLATASSGCVQDAPISTYKLPLLVYSHGYGGNMDMSTYLFREMASKGMIIAAVEHTDGTASSTILKDGRERRFNEYLYTGRQQLIKRSTELLEAVEYLPNELETKYGVDVDTIMLGGHSYGCPSAIMAANGASEGTNVDGLLLHDPALGMGYGMLPPNGAISKIRTITYVSDEYNRANVRYGSLTLHIKGCKHGNFVDAPLWAPIFIMRLLSVLIPAAGSSDPVVIHKELAESTSAFMICKDPMSANVAKGRLFERVR